MTFSNNELGLIFKTLDFAADKHKNQRRKGVDGTPYINHPIKVAKLLVETGKVTDLNIILAALLHDTVEDTETTETELINNFGKEITSYVIEMTDDKSLDKKLRKELQIKNALFKSKGAKLIKICDKICNIKDVIDNPPQWWDNNRRNIYLDWAEKVVDALGEVHPELQKTFFDKLAEGRKLLNEQ